MERPLKLKLVVWILAGAVLVLGRLAPPCAAAAPPLTVEYRPPLLSVEASGVELARILTEIGGKVGFSVVDDGRPAPLITISVRDLPVEEVLRRLLRGENHTVIYAPAGGADPGIASIVLLGAADSSAGGRESESRPAAGVLAESGPAAPQSTPGQAAPSAPVAPQPTPLLSLDWGALAESSADPAAPPITVADILKAHALAAVQASLEADGGQTLLGAGTTPPAMSLDASLAETTRRAQQGLAALITGLQAATRSLQESTAASQK